jgi:hypothetical protein
MDLALGGAFVVIAAKLPLEPWRSCNPCRPKAGPKALQAGVLAMGYARDWRFPQADRWIGLARRADPACPLLVRAGAELDARRSGRDGAVAESG